MSKKKKSRNTSPKQVEANQRNAALSTGPASVEGREIASQNALDWGFHTDKVLIRGETQEAYRLFRKEMLQWLDPRTPEERLFANRMITESWRLDRIPAYEVYLLTEAKNSSEVSKALCRVSLIESRLNRNFWRAYAELRKLQKDRLPVQPRQTRQSSDRPMKSQSAAPQSSLLSSDGKRPWDDLLPPKSTLMQGQSMTPPAVARSPQQVPTA